ncbi:MAG TPA: hypothetical protein VHY22_06690, partial [Chthoniobacteraceae bacterium]|nr:hypothetical protein [Chthoniobacteraceae bacterium]
MVAAPPSRPIFKSSSNPKPGKKPRGKELTAAATFAQELIQWTEQLKKREARQQPAGSKELLENQSEAATGDPAPAAPATVEQQDPVAAEMMRIDPPIASNPIDESLTLINLAIIPDVVEGAASLALAGGKKAADLIGGLAATGVKKIADLASDTARETMRGAASEIVPGGGLQASEDLGGHLLAKHVGKTRVELLSRALTDKSVPEMASSFYDRAS